MKRFILLFMISFFLLSPAWGAEEISLTLNEAISIALRDNRTILLKTEDVKKAQAKLAEAKSGRLPSVTVTGTATDTMGYYSKDLTQETMQTTVKQVLYQGGKINNTIKYNELVVNATEAALEKTKLDMVLTIKKAFYTLFLANEYVELNKAILDNTQEHFDFLRARYEKGQASQSDLLNLEASVSNVRQAYGASLKQVGASQALLNSLLYLGSDVTIKPVAELVYEPKEVIYEEAFVEAMQKRPEIREYEAQVKAAEKSISMAKADNRPTVSASWDYYSRSHVAASTTRSWNDYNIVGVTVSWPIFDGWATKAKVEQAIVDLRAAQLNREKGIRGIIVELKNSYLDFKNAVTKVESTQAEVGVYKDAFSVSENKYKDGIVSSLDYNDGALSYEVSLFKHKEALYDYIIAKSRLDKSIGEL